MKVKLPNGEGIQYLIDGQNRRVGKKVNGTLTEGFLYDGQLNPIAELDGSGKIVEQFIYGTRPNVPDYILKGGVEYRVITDQLGSPELIVNTSTGAIAEQLSYDAWGNVTSDTNPGLMPFRFAGGLYDPDTGLVHFGARDYDPQTGRWTSKDPILFAGGETSLYVYVGDDPINITDHTGLHWEYSQSTGTVTYVNDQTGSQTVVGNPGTSYSGYGSGLDNPDMEGIPNVGPIPVGLYTIGAPENVRITTSSGKPGMLRYALPLIPWKGNPLYGKRNNFYWHGAPVDDRHSASKGCIVSSLGLRRLVAQMRDGASDSLLEVTP